MLPPNGSTSTLINFLPVLQSIVAKLPVVLNAPVLPIAMVNKPNWLVVTFLISLYTTTAVALPSSIDILERILALAIACPVLLRAIA